MSPTYQPDIFSTDGIREPHKHYKAMQALGPVVWLEATGCWSTTNYAATYDVLTRPEVFLSGRGIAINEDMNKLITGSTLNSDGKEHAQRKKVSIKPLMPRSIAPLEDQFRAASQKLVADMPTQVEAVKHIAQFLPVSIVTQLVGLPKGNEDEMLSWASATFNFLGPKNALAESHREALVGLRKFVEDPETPKRLSPDGWAAALFKAEADGKIPEGWAGEQMRDYLNPSLDTTVAATAFGLLKFAQDPDQWSFLRDNPKHLRNAVEEMVRGCTPIRGFTRYADEDAVVEGTTIKKGERIFALFAAANHDPAVFPNPDQFNITRDTSKHLGFGHGTHFCLGMHLARMEMRVLFEALATRIERIDLDGEYAFGLNNIIYGLETLPLKFKFA